MTKNEIKNFRKPTETEDQRIYNYLMSDLNHSIHIAKSNAIYLPIWYIIFLLMGLSTIKSSTEHYELIKYTLIGVFVIIAMTVIGLCKDIINYKAFVKSVEAHNYLVVDCKIYNKKHHEDDNRKKLIQVETLDGQICSTWFTVSSEMLHRAIKTNNIKDWIIKGESKTEPAEVFVSLIKLEARHKNYFDILFKEEDIQNGIM